MTIKDVRTELSRLKYGVTFNGLIISRTGQVTDVLVQVRKGRIRFVSDATNNLIASYPAQIESVAKFLNAFWYANV